MECFTKNTDEWFEKILLLYNKKKREIMGLAARKKVECYSSDYIFSNFIKI